MRAHTGPVTGTVSNLATRMKSLPDSTLLRSRICHALSMLQEDFAMADTIEQIRHSCRSSLEVILSPEPLLELSERDESRDWGLVCEKMRIFPDAIGEFLALLVAASIGADFIRDVPVDEFLLSFVLDLVNLTAPDDILETVFSLLVQCILTENDFIPFILQNVFENPAIESGKIVHVCEFISAVLRNDYLSENLSEAQQRSLLDIILNTFQQNVVSIGHVELILSGLKKFTLHPNAYDVARLAEFMYIIREQYTIIFELIHEPVFENYTSITWFLLRQGLEPDSVCRLIPWDVLAEMLIEENDLCESMFCLLGDLSDIEPGLIIDNLTEYIGTDGQIFNTFYARIFSSAYHDKMGLLHLVYNLAKYHNWSDILREEEEQDEQVAVLIDICSTDPTFIDNARTLIHLLGGAVSQEKFDTELSLADL